MKKDKEAAKELQEAAAKYLQAVDEHAAKIRSYAEALLQFGPETPEDYRHLLSNAERYFQMWRGATDWLFRYSEFGVPSALNLERLLELMERGREYQSAAWHALDQLIYLHREYWYGAKDEQHKLYLSSLDALQQQESDLSENTYKALRQLRLAFIDHPGSVCFPLSTIELWTEVQKLRVEKIEWEAKEKAKPRPHTVVSLAQDFGLNVRLLQRHIKKMRSLNLITSLAEPHKEQRFTDEEKKIICSYILEKGREKTKRKIKMEK